MIETITEAPFFCKNLKLKNDLDATLFYGLFVSHVT